ncbi:MAG: Ig-like domain-containing protein, partial [Rhodoferax sp.]|nr:Ig-like domain-containing protein [Rhodoferax sp.]
TMEIWVNPAKLDSNYAKFLTLSETDLSDNLFLGFDRETGKVLFTGYQAHTLLVNISSPTALSLDTWTHVAATINSSNQATLYINGVSAATATLTTAFNNFTTDTAYLGRSSAWQDDYFSGSLADVRVYNDARTAAEIQADMQGVFDPSDSHLLIATPGLASSTGSGGAPEKFNDWSNDQSAIASLLSNSSITLPADVTGLTGIAISFTGTNATDLLYYGSSAKSLSLQSDSSITWVDQGLTWTVANTVSGQTSKVSFTSSLATGVTVAQMQSVLKTLGYYSASPSTAPQIGIQVFDASGNSSPLQQVALNSTVAAPTLALNQDTGSSASDGFTNAALINITGLVEGGSFAWQIDNSAWQNGSGSTLTATQGLHSYAIAQMDARGNRSTISTFHFDYHALANVTAPVVALFNDTGRSNSDGISNNRTLVVSFDQHFASGNSWRYKVDNSASWTTGSSNTLQGQEGVHTYTVEFTDVAGNVVSATSPGFVVDTVIATPQIALSVDTGRSSSDGVTNNPQISISGLEAQAFWFYSIDGGSWVPGNSANSTFTALSGTHTYRVTQTDVAGNTSSNSNTLTVNYLVASLSSPGLAFLKDTGTGGDDISSEPTISVTGISGSGWQYRVDGGAWQTPSLGNTFQATLGSHTYQVQQFDDAGNTGVSSIVTLNYYTSTPAAPGMDLVRDTGNNTDKRSNNPAVAISGLVAGARAEYKVDSSDWQPLVPGVSTFNASSGEHTYTVRQIHTASGLTSVASGTLTLTIDTTAPSVSVQAQSLGVGQKLHFSSSEVGSAYLVPATAQIASLADILALPATSIAMATVNAANTDTQLNTTGINTGNYKLYSVDAVDNVSTASSNTIQILPAPSVVLTLRDSSGNTQLGTMGVGSILRFHVQLRTLATLSADGSPSYTFKLGDRNLSAPINRARSSASELIFDYALKPGDGSGSVSLAALNNQINPMLLGGASLTNTASGLPLIVAADFLGFADRSLTLASPVGGSDTSAPTLISSTLSSGSRTLNKADIGNSLNWVLVFSEPVTGLAAANLGISSATIGTLGSMVSTGGTVYTIPIRLGNNIASGTLGLTLSASGITDVVAAPAAANAFTAAAAALSLSVNVDTLAPNAPTLALASGLLASSISLTQATQATGVLTVAGESAGSASLRLTGASGATINRSIPTSGTASAQPLVLSAADVALLGSGLVSVQASVSDAAGNSSSNASTSFTLLTSSPVVQSVTDSVPGVYTRALTSITYDLTFDRAVSGLTVADFSVTNATLNSISMNLSNTVATLTLTPQSNVTGFISITLAANSVTDSAGNSNDVFTTNAQAIDTLQPSVSSIALSSSTPALSTIKTGDQVFADVLFSEVVQVSGTPRLNLQLGNSSRIATYTSGTGSNTLRFAYTVASGDADTNGISLSAGSISLPAGAQSATLRDGNGNDAVLSFSAVADVPGIKVDAVAPTMAFSPGQPALHALTGQISLTFSEAVTGLSALNQLQVSKVSDQSVTITTSNFAFNAATNTATFDVSGLDGSGTLNVSLPANTVTDAVGNSNTARSLSIPYARTIALPSGKGQLILGVQVAGRADPAASQNWYYHWDKNGDGVAGAGDEATYTEMLNMVSLTSASSWTNTNRFSLAIPTMSAMSLPSADQDATSTTLVAAGGGTSYSLSPAKTAANTQGTAPNSIHDGLTAIWDAFNGSAVSKPANVSINSAAPTVDRAFDLSFTDRSVAGLPPGWGVAATRENDEPLDSFYWSSLTYDNGARHLTFSLQSGYSDAGSVTADYHYGAFKVIAA